MFDIGFSELVVVGVVALIVIGPERLPKVARTAGHLLGRFQRYASSVKSDISREMQMDELRKVGHDFKESIESTVSDVKTQANLVDDYLKDEIGQLENSLDKTVADAEFEWDEAHHLESPIASSQEFTDQPSAVQHPQQSLDLDTRPAAAIEPTIKPDPKKQHPA